MRTKNIRMVRGQTKVLNCIAKDFTGAKIDLTGAAVYAYARADMKVDPLIKLASAVTAGYRVGIAIDPDFTGAGKGKFVITYIPADTAALVALGADDPYFWEVWVVDAAGKKTPVIAPSRLDLYPGGQATIP